VSRKSVHAWLRRYEQSGLAGLADRSHRPHRQPRQVPAEVEAAICRLRTAHPKWGPRRLVYELNRAGQYPAPSRSTVYRVLVRNHFVTTRPRKKRRSDYKRWERPAPMQLWQMDIVGGVLVGGREYKLVSGVDDHSRFCVIATVVPRATARAVCGAFARALATYGIPEQVLTDNGKQFTGKYSRPRPSEVLFDRICRKNGIEHLLTKPRSPTTTGKVERWHQTLQNELLHEQQAPFASLAAAQTAVDAWRAEYNHTRPHQSLDMASPAHRFHTVPPAERTALPLWLPADLIPLPAPVQSPGPATGLEPAVAQTPDPALATVAGSDPDQPRDAVEVDRVVPASGNLQVAGQQFWLGPHRAGQPVTLWIDTTTVHVSVSGNHLKTLPSRLSTVDLARLRADGARPAGPPPARPSPGLPAAGATVEIDRLVHAQGVVTLAGRQLPIGQPSPAAGSPCAWTRNWSTSSSTACCGARSRSPCPPPTGPGCAAPASPAHHPSPPPPRSGSSGGSPAAAAYRSSANACRSASITPARPSPSRSKTPCCACSTSTTPFSPSWPAPAARRSAATRPTGTPIPPRPRKCHPSDEANLSNIRWDSTVTPHFVRHSRQRRPIPRSHATRVNVGLRAALATG